MTSIFGISKSLREKLDKPLISIDLDESSSTLGSIV
jgi:hypothetical protein